MERGDAGWADLLEGCEGLVLGVDVILVDLVCQQDKPLFLAELDDINLILVRQHSTCGK